MKKISVVISCFNSSKTISGLIERMTKVIKPLSRYQFEFVFVDDGSADDTFKTLTRHSKNHEVPFVILKFKKNYGQIAAILAGLKYSEGDAMIIMSSDIQDPPELIQVFVEEWEKGNDLVGAERTKREDVLFRSIGGWFWYNMVLRKILPDMPQGGSDYALVTKEIAEHIVANTANIRFLQAEIIKYAKNITYIPYKRERIKHDRPSGWNFFKLMGHLLDTAFLHLEMQFPIIVFHCIIVLFNAAVIWLFSLDTISYALMMLSIFTSLALVLFVDTMILLEGAKRIIRSLNTAHMYTIEEIIRTKAGEK